ncbi:LacI family DNA-binding transcriptional regulator [Paenibacillus sp. LHD-38]|uniref:LacI family DNA-binding transcriptional regulator n=1 Tax=Paenibacillus sp. LHD-38 TaxID=3072143 RepID=UPI00280E5B95|nr:LacI family DNA-binding transcriptional regulator [Paenibacillus sp. LHD-38]MDQ8734723.1 LacI family DNA-binding transcriptional regulator [Paenibacillus sp. LHD-38]
MKLKIKDVAEKAGVSVTTVSRVLNGEKYVKDELKAKVQRVIDDLGYSPSHIARSLVRQKTNLIGIIVPDLTSSFYSTILSSIEEAVSLNQYNLLVCNINEDTDKEYKYLNIFKEMRVEGIIIMHEKLNDEIRQFINKLDIPVIFSSVCPEDQKFVSVIIDDYSAAYDTTNYLIGLGHERIAFIGGDLRDVTSGKNRYFGYLKALTDNGIPVVEDYIRFGNYKTQSGYMLMKEMLASEPRPTAVFAVSDDMAVGAMNCIHDHKLNVPDDISIIGFDGSQLTELVRPQLSSMEQPIHEMGKTTVYSLLDLIMDKPSAPKEDIILQHHLVIRDSCKARS